MMTTFTAAYQKAKKVVHEEKFSEDWNTFITTKIKLLLGDTGLDDGMSSSLKKLHRDITYPNRFASFFGVCRNSRERESNVILAAAKEDTSAGLNKRAATLKFLRHIHYLHKRGSQSIWVCSPPKSYDNWVFDELEGASKDKLKTKLSETEEIFNKTHMKNMSVGTQDSLKWCNKALILLGRASAGKKADADALKMVKRWFADDTTSENDLNQIISKLKSGITKIRNVCNSNQLIFSDDPVDRSTQNRLWSTTYALVRTETLSVIYIEKVLMGRSGTRQEWAITVVHELSHREMQTKDHFYSESGLKPDSGTFPSAKTIDNADNVAFFVADCSGQLTDGKKTAVLKAPAA
ncbi:MAG: M35 family metallo-endopeptidase [Sedimenticola sp.]